MNKLYATVINNNCLVTDKTLRLLTVNAVFHLFRSLSVGCVHLGRGEKYYEYACNLFLVMILH